MYCEDKILVLFCLFVLSYFKYKKGIVRMLYGIYDVIKLCIVI